MIACGCYKKQDSGRVHESCLRGRLESGDCESNALRCPICQEVYKIRVNSKWDVKKLSTWASAKRASNLCVNVMVFICFVVSMSTLSTDFYEHPKTVMVIAIIGVGVGLSTIQTVMVLYRRWRYQGSLVSVTPEHAL